MFYFWKKNNFQLVTLFGISTLMLFASETNAFASPGDVPSSAIKLEQLRKEWDDRSVNYYSKVMREERRRNIGQINPDDDPENFTRLAKKHYFAYRKIKDGQHRHAEVIYRRIITEIMNEDEDGGCDHAKLAVTTLLLALHCQRMGDIKKARSVFLDFFRAAIVNNGDDIGECACSAKVLGAYALFEMKQGNELKALLIAQKAVQFDEELEAVLQWKQFRQVGQRTSKNQ